MDYNKLIKSAVKTISKKQKTKASETKDKFKTLIRFNSDFEKQKTEKALMNDLLK